MIDEFFITLVAICEPKVLPCDIHVIGTRLKMDSWLVNSEGSIWVFYQNSFTCNHVKESSQHLSLKVTSQLLSSPVYFFLSMQSALSRSAPCFGQLY